jgi:catechol 2,3-dioxygenase-like lactoylglutathione lyase family enzyme
MITRVDHLMLVVDDVEAAMNTFDATLGMNARYGGAHPRGTHNALVHFPGKLGYLELIGPRDREQVRQSNPAMIDYIAKGGGIWRIAVGTDDAGAENARLRDLGVPAADVADWSRDRPDGTTVRWRMFGVTAPETPRLFPFFIQWPPPEERVPDLEQAGFLEPSTLPVTGIERVVFAVDDLDRAVAAFERTYGVTAAEATDAPQLGGRSRLITLDEGAIELIQPTGAGPARDILDQRGPGPFLLVLESSDLEGAHTQLTQRGVRVTPIAPRDDGRPAFQIDPRDAHGVALQLVANR